MCAPSYTHLPPVTSHCGIWKYDYGDDIKAFMTVDHRIEWDSKEKEMAQALAGTIITIFPVGVPLMLFILLFVNRDRIMQRQTRSGDEELGHIGT